MNISIKKKRYLSLVWLLLWLPLSQLFPVNTHFPLGAMFAPITAWFAPFSGSVQSNFSFDLQYIYFPALFFWLAGLLFVFGLNKRFKKGV